MNTYGLDVSKDSAFCVVNNSEAFKKYCCKKIYKPDVCIVGMSDGKTFDKQQYVSGKK